MPPNENQGTEPSFEEIMQFDPFGGTAGDSAPAETGQEASASGDATSQSTEQPQEEQQVDSIPAAQPAATQPQVAPPTTQPAQRPVTQEDLVASIRASTEAITRSIQPQQTPVAAQPRPNKFNLGIPDQLLGALRSEDQNEFRAGVGALVNSMANHIWENFQQAIQQEFAPAVRQMITQHTTTQSQQDQVSRDFYGTYPELNNPAITPMIQTVGAQLAEEYARAGRSFDWSPQMRDAIAQRVFATISTITGQPFQRQVQQPQSRVQQTRRPFSTGNGARPAPNTDINSPEEMMKMIFG